MIHFNKSFITILCNFFLLVSSICDIDAQDHIGYDLLNNKSSITKHFTLSNDLIILDVSIAPFIKGKFIFDTGATNNILFDKDYLKFTPYTVSDSVQIYGANRKDLIDALVYRAISVSIHAENYIKRDFIVLDKFNSNTLSKYMDENVLGILGGNFIRGLQIEIDYVRKTLKFQKPSLGNDDKSSILNIENRKPYIKSIVKHNDKLPPDEEEILLDTGSSIDYLLSLGNHKVDNDSTLNNTQHNEYLGIGISGPIYGQNHNVDYIKIGQYIVSDIQGGIQVIDTLYERNDFKAGIMGASILQRFKWVIDYSHERFTATPNKYFKAPKINRTGLFIAYDDQRQIIIDHIKKGSPAEIAGLRKNDKIVRYKCYPTKWFGINWLRKKLRSKKGKARKYRFKVVRGNTTKIIYLYLD